MKPEFPFLSVPQCGSCATAAALPEACAIPCSLSQDGLWRSRPFTPVPPALVPPHVPPYTYT